MPSASDESRERAERLWGSIDCGPIEKFLKDRGYKLTKKWFWILPSPEHKITEDESFALQFLFEEWDYGGIAADASQL